jgi:ribosome-interacting GTPase 1
MFRELSRIFEDYSLFYVIIHTELGEGFIYAVEAREKKRIGEDHVLKDRDVISIISTKKRA